ncbi:MAG: LysR family transcriptional regulator [Tindallia sp. MSAO_Bac2]|nr:MAG: LysR family transcriptional regulator [Tindallia sp. MSAO_Bac2]
MPNSKKDSFSGFQLYMQIKDKKQLSTDKLFLLLEKIGKEGSISKAAADLELSYRYAWGLIQDAEKALSVKLLNKKIGGSEGGGASLTEDALEMLSHYQVIRDAVNEQLGALLDTKSREKASQPANPPAQNPLKYLLIASTMEPVETGLLDVLEQVYYQKTGVLVRHIGVGSGKAMEIGKSGGADLLLVHSPQEEAAFMRQGLGAYRKEFMTNRYYLVGPKSDPAGLQVIKEDSGISVFFRQLVLTKMPLISRNDQSGTHSKEREIWQATDTKPAERNIIPAQGVSSNLGVLRMAYEKSAYALTDSTSYQLSEYQKELAVFAGDGSASDTSLINTFSIIVIKRRDFNPEQYQEAMNFAFWLSGPEGKKIVKSFPNHTEEAPFFQPTDMQ